MAVALVDSVVLIDYKDRSAGDRHDRAEAIVQGGSTPTTSRPVE